MAEILETIMLIAFGLSWPINVYKNFKARTAKSMSLWFILLIIFGYVAGIAAKILSNRVNYVLAVYVLNLVMVSANLIVYIINRRYDRAGYVMAGEQEA
jgi:membrane protein DedA with SNARE-associated domain